MMSEKSDFQPILDDTDAFLEKARDQQIRMLWDQVNYLTDCIHEIHSDALQESLDQLKESVRHRGFFGGRR